MIIIIFLPTETQVFSVGGNASRTQDSPARWGLATILRAVNAESLTLYDWLLSSMNTEISTDNSEDYSVSYIIVKNHPFGLNLKLTKIAFLEAG